MVLAKGDKVYVRRSRLDLEDNDISPFYRTTIQDRKPNGRSVKVDKPDGGLSEWIATSKITTNFGVLIVRIGDFNEEGLLDPLAKSVLHYCRMLLPGDAVRLVSLRTEAELATFWEKFHTLCQQVVIIGHADPGGFLFGKDTVSAQQLGTIFSAPNPSPKEFISLGCQTGKAGFAKTFSSFSCVSHFIAPFHSVHGCVASLFTQTFLNERLIASYSTKVAFNHARDDLLGAVSFRLWKNGALTEGPT
jgi:hypothetical protein